jgi:hypothetical protein
MGTPFLFAKKTAPTGCMVAVLAGALISLASSSVRADDDEAAGSTNINKRPIEELFKTDVVYPQEKGELEAELASVYQNHVGGDSWTVPISMEYGFTDRWQVEAEWDSLVQRFPRNQSVVRGVGDLELGTQYSFMNVGDSLFHIAPRFSIQVPIGNVNEDLSEGFMEFDPAVILARDFPELHHTQFFTEMGASFVQRINKPRDSDNAEPAAHELNLGTGFFVLFPHGAATMEFNWANNRWNHHGAENDMYLTPGYLWRVAWNMEIGLGIPIGLNRSSDQFEVSAHVTWEF